MNAEARVEILLVEDSAQDAEMALRSFRRHHFADKVYWVRDGADALDFMFRRGGYAGRTGAQPKLVLLDIKMPRVDGIEVLRQLKDSEATRATPVVIMTSSSEERDVAESYLLGVNSYIVKPVQFEAFLKVVSAIGMYWLLTNRIPGDA